jgi:hypothetical protein
MQRALAHPPQLIPGLHLIVAVEEKCYTAQGADVEGGVEREVTGYAGEPNERAGWEDEGGGAEEGCEGVGTVARTGAWWHGCGRSRAEVGVEVVRRFSRIAVRVRELWSCQTSGGDLSISRTLADSACAGNLPFNSNPTLSSTPLFHTPHSCSTYLKPATTYASVRS